MYIIYRYPGYPRETQTLTKLSSQLNVIVNGGLTL